MNICWESDRSYLLLNPSYSKKEQHRFHAILDAADTWPGHIWLATSGSSAQKWVGLSKKALLSSAKAVNQHLHSNQEDHWVNALPFFHVGGLSIWARAHLSGAKVSDFKQHLAGKWRAEAFIGYLEQVQGTLSALVPTQLHDLVMLGKKAPSHIRALIIGGGALLPALYERAVALGWPVLPSYGLTECASQVATAKLGSWQDNQQPALQLLPHVQAFVCNERLCFTGSSLLTTYACLAEDQVQFFDPKQDGWLISEDCGSLEQGEVIIKGRADGIVKVGGENVDVNRLDQHLQALRLSMGWEGEITLLAMADERLGHSIYCVSNQLEQHTAPLIECFQQSVLPFERIRKVYFLSKLPRSSLGKILRSELIEAVRSYTISEK